MSGSAQGGLKEQVFVYYNYHSVPIPTEKINNLVKHITNEYQEYERMFVCCDVRSVSKEFTDSVELITKAELCHMDVNAVETSMCERIKWHSKALKVKNPVVMLISDSGSFGSTLTQLSRLGWKVIIFHPPNTLSSFLDYADLAIPLPVYRSFEADGLDPIFDVPATIAAVPVNNGKDVGQGLSELLNRLSNTMGSPSNYQYKMFGSEETKKPNIKPNTLFATEGEHVDLMSANLSYANVTSGIGSKVSTELINIVPEISASPFYATPPPPCFPPQIWNGSQVNMQISPATVTLNKQQLPLAVQNKPAMEKKNPFQQKNPFSKENPFKENPFQENPFKNQEVSTNRWSAMEERPSSTGITGGQRNPFGGAPKVVKEVFVRTERREKQMPTQAVQPSGSKFRKPAQQCPLWEEKEHRQIGICTLWHPNKSCMYFPHCSAGAIGCGYAHPFCTSNGCVCSKDNKNPQFNHDAQVRFMHKEDQM